MTYCGDKPLSLQATYVTRWIFENLLQNVDTGIKKTSLISSNLVEGQTSWSQGYMFKCIFL